MHSLLTHHLMRQLPYEVRWNSEAIYNSVEIKVDGNWIRAEPWNHHPSNIINKANDESHRSHDEVVLERDNIHYPPSSQYPSRQPVVTNFARLHAKYGIAISDVSSKGLFEDLPSNLLPPSVDINVIRPDNTGKSRFIHTACVIHGGVTDTNKQRLQQDKPVAKKPSKWYVYLQCSSQSELGL